MSDIIYTPPASGGGGTTINPTNNVIPVRLNATTFVDSNIFNQVGNFLGTYFLGNGAGFYLDYSNGLYQFGDYSIANQGTLLNVDDTNQVIITQNQGNDLGIGLDFANDLYSFGDFNSVSSGTSFFINIATSTIYTQHSGQNEGLYLDFVNDYFQIGDFAGTNNGVYLSIDDDNRFIKSYYNGNAIGLNLDFVNEQFNLGDYNGIGNGNYIIVDNTVVEEVIICANKQLNIKGASIQLSSSLSYANENLQVKAPDGNIYYIPLYN